MQQGTCPVGRTRGGIVVGNDMTTSDEERPSSREHAFYQRLLDLGTRDRPEPLLDAALSLAVEISAAECGYLELHDDGSSAPRYWRAFGLEGAEIEAVRTSISRGIIARTIAAGEIIESADALFDERFAGFASVRDRGIRAVLCAPIGKAPPRGIIYLHRTDRAGPFTSGDREKLELFAKQLATLADRFDLEQTPKRFHDHTHDVRARFTCNELVGTSESLAQVLLQASLVAQFEMNVLITGKPGTGKTALARSIAANSRRKAGPFISVNCSTLQDTLFEGTLFGAERGAHSMAMKKQLGLVASAEGGTLFLDEVGDLTPASQAKMLQLLQERIYFPLGATAPIQADVRFIAATNVDLGTAVADRRFRADLYDRLRVFTIEIPDLAQRRDDIVPLADAIVDRIVKQNGLPLITMSPRAAMACREAAWHGNVRELENRLMKGVITAFGEGSNVVLEHHVFPAARDDRSTPTFQEATRRFQRRFLLEALEANGWNVLATAEQVGLARSHIYNLIHSFGLARQ
jgi:Nif-specific regulatory protein